MSGVPGVPDILKAHVIIFSFLEAFRPLFRGLYLLMANASSNVFLSGSMPLYCNFWAFFFLKRYLPLADVNFPQQCLSVACKVVPVPVLQAAANTIPWNAIKPLVEI